MDLNQISASIVLYKNDDSELKNAIESVLNTNYLSKLYLVDNSPSDLLRIIDSDERIVYIFNNINLGFGAGHNIAIKKSIECGMKYHLIMNPDISFKEGVIENIFDFMERNVDVGLLMPQVLSKNGEIQYLPKLLPTPFDLLLRKMPLPYFLKHKVLQKYELRGLSEKEPSIIAIISGCFSFFRIEILKKTGCYDENYFMYFEDFDISRRAMKYSKNIYYPLVSVVHGYEKGANKNINLTRIYIRSAITYFSKWGWIFDKERTDLNNTILKKLNHWLG